MWGGGTCCTYLFRSAYDTLFTSTCSDLMCANQFNHNPSAVLDQDIEIRCNIRNLLSHVSVVVWNTINECYVEDNSQ